MNFQEAWSVRHEVAPLLDLRAWGGGLGVLGIAYLLGLAVLPRLGGWRFGARLLLRLLAGLALAPLALLGIGQIPGAVFAFPWWVAALAGWGVILVALARGRGGFDLKRETVETVSSISLSDSTSLKRGANGKEMPGQEIPSKPHAPSPHLLLRILTLAGWGLVGLSLLGRLMAAFCPPVAYDTLEYHQGIIPNIFQLGRVAPIPHVFYTAQPLATEMLYTLAALLEGTPWGYGPGVIHWALVVLVALLAGRILARLEIDAAWRPWLVLLLLEHMLMFKLQIERMSDWFGVLMLAGGVWAFLEGRSAERGARRGGMWNAECGMRAGVRTAALMGLFVGGAMEAKWTHAGTVAVPLLVLALGLGWDALKSENSNFKFQISNFKFSFRIFLPALICGLVGLGLWLPWGVWLAVVRGNPFHPFMAGVFPSAEWPPERLHFLLAAHEPLRFTQALYWTNLFHRLTTGLEGPPLILLALAGAAVLALLRRGLREDRGGNPLLETQEELRKEPQRSRKEPQSNAKGGGVEYLTTGNNPENPGVDEAQSDPDSLAGRFAFRLAIGMVGSLLLWGNLRQAADRFLGPTLLAAVLVFAVVLQELLALLERRRSAGGGLPLRPIITGLLAVLALINVTQNLGLLAPMAAHARGEFSRARYMDIAYPMEMKVIRAANALPPSARILALNDARRYLYTGRIEMASVFDRSPIRPAVTGAANSETIRRRLVEQGYTHILFNGFEQVRILRMQTPLSLMNDPQFKALLNAPEELRGEANRILATRYRGITEFSVDPLTPGERRAYEEFLEMMRAKATASVPGEPGAEPAFWLAPLGAF